jgi:hypothetical protein
MLRAARAQRLAPTPGLNELIRTYFVAQAPGGSRLLPTGRWIWSRATASADPYTLGLSQESELVKPSCLTPTPGVCAGEPMR